MSIREDRRTGSKWALAGAVLLWSAVTGMGIAAMIRYETTPGAGGRAPRAWPQDSALALPDEGAGIFVFLHPRCSCSEATLTAIESLSGSGGRPVRATVVVVTPWDRGQAWLDSSLVRRAKATPGVSIVEDRGGAESRRFGAMTSGFTLVYVRAELRFAGGLTPARGVAGASTGWLAVRSVLDGLPAAKPETKTFGCALHDAGAASGTKGGQL